ncbi:MAG: dephospho-CoA kinase [Woeseiaceae bacterium]|jgi:dephospho-CoA kinase|nr:dephospho-CoA kinase [Woeseiaceae bacterium]
MTRRPQLDPDVLRIGLTGGIASGKSTVADILANLGAQIIDTDVVAREVVEPGQPALDEIRDAFGDDVFEDDGTLDRRRLRERIFASPRDRERLEHILHPRIRDATISQAASLEGPYQVIVVPLLTGSSLVALVDRVLVVDCDEATQVERLLDRDAESEEQARRILAAQASREERLAIADDVIVNDGSLEELESRASQLHENYVRLSQNRD